MTSSQEKKLEQTDEQLISNSSRRAALKKLMIGRGVAVGGVVLPGKWTQPLMEKVLVPAHAQTSCSSDWIRVSSLNPPNDFRDRSIAIYNSDGDALASCVLDGGIATATGLEPGTYTVGASNSEQATMEFIVETECSSDTFNVVIAQNGTDDCLDEVAIVSIPDGTITRRSGGPLGPPFEGCDDTEPGCVDP